MGCQEVGTDRGSGRSGSVGPCRHVLSTVASPFAEPLANPLLSKWLCVLKDAWFCHRLASSSAAMSSIRQGRQPWESSRFYRPYLSRGGFFKPPKPLATARVRAAQHSRVASAPRRITGATTAVLKPCPTDPAEPFAITFAPPREWLRVKDHVPPETELHREGFKMLQAFRSNRRFMVSTSSPMSCGLRRNAFAPALRATASERVPDVITMGIYSR